MQRELLGWIQDRFKKVVLLKEKSEITICCILITKRKGKKKKHLQVCSFSGNYLNSGFHEVQNPALPYRFTHFFQALQAFSFKSAYIPDIRQK